MTSVDEQVDLAVPPSSDERAPGIGGRINWGDVVVTVAAYAVSVAIALALSAALIATTHHSPHDAFIAMRNGAFWSKGAWGRTLEQASPLLIVALGSVIANRAGVFNIGQEGQLLIGAMAGSIVALKLGGPTWLIVPLVLVAAFIGGALWAGIAAVLKIWRNVDVVITTLLLIFIAVQLVQFAVTRQWFLQQQQNTGIAAPQSDRFPDIHMPRFGSPPRFYLQSGLILGLALALGLAWLLSRSRWGFRLKMLGLNPNAARRAGVSVVAVGGGALLLSGGFAGLAGGVVLTSTVFSLQPSLANNIGWEGLLVALVARNRPIAVIFVAIFFGALRAGGGFLATTGVPKYMVQVIQAFLVLSTLFPPMFLAWRAGRRVARAGPELSAAR